MGLARNDALAFACWAALPDANESVANALSPLLGNDGAAFGELDCGTTVSACISKIKIG